MKVRNKADRVGSSKQKQPAAKPQQVVNNYTKVGHSPPKAATVFHKGETLGYHEENCSSKMDSYRDNHPFSDGEEDD